MRNLSYFSADNFYHKERVQQLDFIGAFLQSNIKHRVFVMLYSIYGKSFPEYLQLFWNTIETEEANVWND